MEFGEFVFLSLELADEVEHAPGVGGVDGDAFEHFGQHEVPGFFVGALEDEGGHEVDEEAGDCVGVADEIEHEFDQFLLELALQRYHDVLNQHTTTVSSLRLLVTLSWHSSSHAK